MQKLKNTTFNISKKILIKRDDGFKILCIEWQNSTPIFVFLEKKNNVPQVGIKPTTTMFTFCHCAATASTSQHNNIKNSK